MPKMKTSRLMRKKCRVNAKGKVKFAHTGMRHNTGKKSSSRNRQMQTTAIANPANVGALRGLLPYAGVKN